MNSSDKVTNNPLHHYFRAAIIIIFINHLIGLLGLNSPMWQSQFEKIASVNLLLSFVLVMVFHGSFDSRFFIFCAFAFIVGMAAEIAGVSTGQVFGSYYYTPSFGWKVMGVPVIIGINWILLSYVTAVAVTGYFQHLLFRVVAAALLMVLIDLLLEHFAIRHHFWVWYQSSPPLQNYISWFFVSVIIQIVYITLIPDTLNVSARYYLIILLLFLSADLLLSFCFRTF